MSIGNELRWILVICGTVLLLAIYWWGRRNRREREPLSQRSEAQFTAFANDAQEEETRADDPVSAHDDTFGETITVDEISWQSPPASDDLPEVRVHDEGSPGRREPVMGDDFEVKQGEDFPARVPAEAPTLSDEVPMQASVKPAPASLSSRGAAKSTAQRKIVALRLAVANNALQGEQLLSLLKGARLEHGKFGIFHRMEENAAVFSVASMVEPGSFDLANMEQSQYPGVTLFMLLPGPLDGLIAFDQMLNFGRRLEQTTSGVLQDERGRPLTLQVLERLRNEVMDFQHLHGGLS